MYHGFIRAAFWNISETGPRLTDEELGYSFYGNRLVGVPRLRQLRVRNDSCSIHPDFKSYVTECFGQYSEATQSVESYGIRQLLGFPSVDGYV